MNDYEQRVKRLERVITCGNYIYIALWVVAIALMSAAAALSARTLINAFDRRVEEYFHHEAAYFERIDALRNKEDKEPSLIFLDNFALFIDYEKTRHRGFQEKMYEYRKGRMRGDNKRNAEVAMLAEEENLKYFIEQYLENRQ